MDVSPKQQAPTHRRMKYAGIYGCIIEAVGVTNRRMEDA